MVLNAMGAQDEVRTRVMDGIAAVEAKASALSDEDREAAESQIPGVLARLEVVTAWVEHLLGSVDPELLSLGSFDVFVGPLQQVAQTLEVLPSDPAGYALNLSGVLDAVVMAGPGQAVATPPMRELSDRAAALGRTVTRRLNDLEREMDAHESRLQEWQNQAQAANDALTEAREQETESLRSEIAALRETLTTQTTEADTLLSGFQTTFDHNELQRDKAWKSSRDALSERIDEYASDANDRIEAAITAMNESADAAITSLRSNADETFEHVESRRKKIESIYEIVFKEGTASAFSAEAEKERGQANIWRIVAIGFATAAVLIAALTAFLSHPSGLDVEELIARLASAVAFGAIAAYAGQQSGRHRRREEDAKQLELDLTAIGPFVEEIDEAKRDEVRQLFVQRWMESRSRDYDAESDDVPALTAAQLAKVIVSQLQK
jgi:hypothetical protein